MAANLLALRDAREKTIALLTDHFAKDDLDMEEFERRLTVAHRAENIHDLDRLVADLPATPAPTTALARAPKPAPIVPAPSVVDRRTMVAIMGGFQRNGTWTAPRHLRIFCFWGGAELDFRDARLPEGTTEVSVFAMMGGVQIIVPPGLAVEMDGTAIMGGFEHMERAPAEPDPDRPVLRVRGFVMMGGVSVQTRLPGESERDARRREKKERKQLRGR
jgi:hypothetical protein